MASVFGGLAPKKDHLKLWLGRAQALPFRVLLVFFCRDANLSCGKYGAQLFGTDKRDMYESMELWYAGTTFFYRKIG